MSAHEPPQFTPAQVLDAGRRAEAGSRSEFALQLYTHLAQHYPGTPEAGAALQGLARLSPVALPQPAKGGWDAAPGPGAGGFEPRLQPAPALQPLPAGPFDRATGPEPAFNQPVSSQSGFNQPAFDPSPGFNHQPDFNHHPPFNQPAFNQPAMQPPPFTAPAADQPSFTQWPAVVDEPPLPAAFSRGAELPPPLRDYRSGRLVARIVVWLGVLQVAAGLALLPIALLSPRTISALPLMGALMVGPMMGVGLVVAGLAQIVLGQVARALLEQANATRDMAAVMRAQSGGAETARPRGRRR